MSSTKMPSQSRRKLISRRRHDDDGEEEGSIVDDGYSISDGSASTGEDDAEASDITGDEELIQAASQNQGPTHFTTSADTQAMMNGLRMADSEQELQFDAQMMGARQEIPSGPRRDQEFATRSNPAFVPNRGGFFLHDDRNREQPAPFVPRGRGRGYQGFGRGYGMPFSQPTDRQWAHDLHESVNRIEPSPIPPPEPKGPNRSFSTTTVLGKISVQVFLPGMNKKKTYPNVVKTHYTLLPQHRPPLRRDKPVRVSIPNEHPRYIFPSTERSFIFIPRALRPNQQVFRGRGRGSWQGSRRNSVFGSHTPSVAMSRRSSLGGSVRSGQQTPTNRPVVRMPIMPPDIFFQPEAPIIHSPPASLPMHQPRPQKAVSVADIESPTKVPPQEPFHQQMPPNFQKNTPLAHIPEGAVYAQPFQPYPMMPQYYPYPPFDMAYGGPVVPMMQQFDQLPHESNGMVYYDQYGPEYQFPVMGVPMFYPPQNVFYPQQSG